MPVALPPPPTVLSTFEVLYSLQFPPGIGPTTVQTADESVIKGWFLTLSNPNPSAYTFDIGFHCNVNPTPPQTQRTLAMATAFLDDGTPGTPLTFSTSANGVDFSLRVTVAAGGTVLVGVLPQIFLGANLPTPNVEVRGWADIKLPALLRFEHGLIRFVPQSAVPVPVIATPEQRLTFLPIAGDAATAVEAQTAFTLPLASGQSSFSVPPQPGRLIIFEPAPAGVPIAASDLRTLEGMNPDTLSTLLGSVLAGAKEPAMHAPEMAEAGEG